MVETTEMAIKSMDSQLRNVLSETPEADRGKLISVCLKSIPNGMNFVECVIVVSALSKMGLVDINNIANDQIDFEKYGNQYGIHDDACYCTINTDGRITGLYITPDNVDEYDLPAIIGCLERLTCLTLNKCRSLPVELSNLPHLEKLQLLHCSLNLNLIENFPIQMQLNNLKILTVSSAEPIPAASQFLKWITSQLPRLETLEHTGIETNDVSSIIDSLRTNDICNSLKHLRLSRRLMEEESFEILMLEIVPKFRNLKSLSLFGNNINSFLPIVDSIKNDRTFVPSKSLCVLDVACNPVFKKMEDDPIEKAALLSFLGTFNTIHTLGIEGGKHYDSDLEYALRINHAGRRIVVKVDGGSNNNNDDGKTIVPSSLWPTILERAYEKSLDIYNPRDRKKNATGIYYLLREVGPALLSGGRRRPNACIVSKHGGDGVSLKRKDIITTNERVSETRNNNNKESSSS